MRISDWSSDVCSSDLFALKAVIIGGGYATGRELAEYFVPAGPWGGLAAMLLATAVWSLVAALTFALARALGAYDCRTFFKELGSASCRARVCQTVLRSGVEVS